MIQVTLVTLTDDEVAYTIYLNQTAETSNGFVSRRSSSLPTETFTFTYQRHAGMESSRLTIGIDADQIIVVRNETAEDIVRFHYQIRENGELVRELHLELAKDGEEIFRQRENHHRRKTRSYRHESYDCRRQTKASSQLRLRRTMTPTKPATLKS
ncbi:MAG: hypothetical protein MZU97_00820 [Bacillus subtilis]|nr:hypothetical protein [Bacillus subtilis]